MYGFPHSCRTCEHGGSTPVTAPVLANGIQQDENHNSAKAPQPLTPPLYFKFSLFFNFPALLTQVLSH